MGFARCGVEGNLRNILENTRKKLIHFYIFLILKNGKVFASVRFSFPLSVAVTRTSQSPFPLPAIIKPQYANLQHINRRNNKNSTN